MAAKVRSVYILPLQRRLKASSLSSDGKSLAKLIEVMRSPVEAAKLILRVRPLFRSLKSCFLLDRSWLCLPPPIHSAKSWATVSILRMGIKAYRISQHCCWELHWNASWNPSARLSGDSLLSLPSFSLKSLLDKLFTFTKVEVEVWCAMFTSH